MNDNCASCGHTADAHITCDDTLPDICGCGCDYFVDPDEECDEYCEEYDDEVDGDD